MMLLVKCFNRCWNLDREDEDDRRDVEGFQLFSTRVEKEGSVSHICSSLNGLIDLRIIGSVSNN